MQHGNVVGEEMDAHSKELELYHRPSLYVSYGAPRVEQVDYALADIFANERQAWLWCRPAVEQENPPGKNPPREHVLYPFQIDPPAFRRTAPYAVGRHHGRVELECSLVKVKAPVQSDNSFFRGDPFSLKWTLGRVGTHEIFDPESLLIFKFSDTYLWEYYISEVIVFATCLHIHVALENSIFAMDPRHWHRLHSLGAEAMGGFLLRFGALFDG